MTSTSLVVLSAPDAPAAPVPRRWRLALVAAGLLAVSAGGLLALDVPLSVVAKFTPYLLLVACPVMPLLMCRSGKAGAGKPDGAAQ